MKVPKEIVRTRLPTSFGHFEARAFEAGEGLVLLALVKGEIDPESSVLCRIHSECLTGDALGSRRCDCGPQLDLALRRISAEGQGILVYALGHEGRGIGLLNKLLAYRLQDQGLDTVDANLELHLPVDARDFSHAAWTLRACGARRVRLLTNNPVKATALEEAGIEVDSIEPMMIAPSHQSRDYLLTKHERLGHLNGTGSTPGLPLVNGAASVPNVEALLGSLQPRPDRPSVILKFAQTLDGRLATSTGDSKWISGMQERQLTHALRAACDAVLVGSGTVLKDDPQLTVRLVPGSSPLRVVLDSLLRLPRDRQVFSSDASTLVFTSHDGYDSHRHLLEERGIGVRAVRSSPEGLDLRECLAELRKLEVETVLVEGGARVLTSFLREGLADRVIIAVAPILLGSGKESVGDLGIRSIAEALHLVNEQVFLVGRDMVLAADLLPKPTPQGQDATPSIPVLAPGSDLHAL